MTSIRVIALIFSMATGMAGTGCAARAAEPVIPSDSMRDIDEAGPEKTEGEAGGQERKKAKEAEKMEEMDKLEEMAPMEDAAGMDDMGDDPCHPDGDEGAPGGADRGRDPCGPSEGW